MKGNKGHNNSLQLRADFSELVEAFALSHDVKESSRQLYRRTIGLFLRWVQSTGRDLSAMSRMDIIAYKESLLNDHLASMTVGSYLVAVRQFYTWAEANKLYPNIAKGVQAPKKAKTPKKQHLSFEKSGELLAHFEKGSARDFAMINLMLRTGLRTIEVVRCDVGDITFKGERRVLKIWGKGRTEKDDFVVLTDKAYLPIKKYLATRKGVKDGDPLFVSASPLNKGQRLSTRTVSHICKAGLRSIGLDGREYTAHSLRHTTAVALLLRTGENIYRTQKVMRHASPVTTQIYLESLKEDESRLKNAPEVVLDNAF